MDESLVKPRLNRLRAEQRMVNWANEPRFTRLRVEAWKNVIAFIDTVAGDMVQVAQSENEPYPQAIIVNGGKVGLEINPVIKGRQEEGVTMRAVYHYVTREHCEALRVGLTVHRSWFSSTPHTFELSPEPGFEEVFYFRSSDAGTKALLEGEGLWPDGSEVDASWPVRNAQFVQIPMGRHRVAVLPTEDESRPQWWYWWCYLALPGRGWEK